ncbi:MAG: ATP12 family protein [Rhizomicrobium sp.]|nr:ATP12 family protein [Rhizomicrobium sp.]
MKRFYKEVTVSPEPFRILLDGRGVKTPLRAALTLPTQALAEAVAEEWRGQGDEINPHAMKLTKLANTAIDRVALMKDEVVAQIVAYANDTLCYRASFPADLAQRQQIEWEPPLAWLAERYGVRLETKVGVTHFAQDPEAVAVLRQAVETYDAFVLAALHNSATILASLTLTLALAEGRLSAAEAFAISELDARFQAERWGQDEEAAKRAEGLLAELIAAETFIRLASQ